MANGLGMSSNTGNMDSHEYKQYVACFHEAAHATVALALGFTEVDVTMNGGNGKRSGAAIDTRQFEKLPLTHKLAYYFAGAFGEWILYKRLIEKQASSKGPNSDVSRWNIIEDIWNAAEVDRNDICKLVGVQCWQMLLVKDVAVSIKAFSLTGKLLKRHEAYLHKIYAEILANRINNNGATMTVKGELAGGNVRHWLRYLKGLLS